MNRIARAEQLLSAAGARNTSACLPGGATSPADVQGTLSLPHELIAECDAAARAEAQLRELARQQSPAASQTRSPDTRTA